MSKVDENREFVEKEIFEVKMDQWKGRVWKKKKKKNRCFWTRVLSSPRARGQENHL
jgi:hypothetical protein